ncbi:hypothetical protein [Ferruginivarius sediminum]|uniref:Uncharacterized protein n=1 Tax=Ferruginivarius sediminum TaxID=2661937 RepID=A0A369THU6_9PROT|nr:hypothetical protein [Ferruginivarius sediminum]RDD63687.1 hypothetical protein DRB17_00445 [Ferruginivarius sediminum]
MKLMEHENVTATDVELEPSPDGTMHHILIVHTNLPLIESEPNYDEDKLTQMLKDIQAWMREHTSFHCARIRHRS